MSIPVQPVEEKIVLPRWKVTVVADNVVQTVFITAQFPFTAIERALNFLEVETITKTMAERVGE
jgi:hypothetical protein